MKMDFYVKDVTTDIRKGRDRGYRHRKMNKYSAYTWSARVFFAMDDIRKYNEKREKTNVCPECGLPYNFYKK